MAAHPAEEALLEALEAFLRCVVAEAPFAEEGVREARGELTALIREGGPTEARDRSVLSLLGMYGGMGSVNDFPWSHEGEAAKEALYERLKEVRGLYHGLAGGERHDPASFPVLEVGARVRLLPGSVYYVDTSGRPSTVDETFPPGAVWEVTIAYGPDITGMPSYGLRHGNRHVAARFEALDVVDA